MRPNIEKKAKQVQELVNLIKQYKVVGIVDIKSMPAAPFKEIKKKVPGVIKVMKKVVIERALKEAGIEGLDLGEMPAILLSNEDAFKLAILFKENQIPVYAKAGQIAPEDIVVKAGPTPFPPGPMVSEFNKLGIKVRPQAGKLHILQDKVLVKAGEEINEAVASMLMKLDIKPMKVGLKFVSAFEDGKVYTKELDFSVEEILTSIETAYADAYKLSIGLPWVTKDNVDLIIQNAYIDAKKLALGAEIEVPELLPELMAKATAQANALSEVI